MSTRVPISPTRPAQAGGVFGMYELIERIAVGGMAEIYLARELDGDSGEYLVVKRILPSFATDRELVSMFLDEQRVAVTLMHANIVRTYDVGQVEGDYFISMEYLHGEDVRRIFRMVQKRRDRLPLAVAINLIAQAAAGLNYAHDKRGMDLRPLNIVHRDVTPHNLVVTFDGLVKLVDFGVAKAANRHVDTKVGTIKGKIPYMSPEQCKGLALDRRCDLYALGVILYEVTTGTRVYGAGGSDIALMRRIVDEAVEPPSARVEGYPLALERIVLKALQKDPAHRYQTAAAIRADLEAFARSQRIDMSTQALSDFMSENFHNEFMAWQSWQSAAVADVSKIIESFKHRERDDDGKVDTDEGAEPLGDDEFVFRIDDPSPLLGTDESSRKHLSASLSESLASVWGAANAGDEPGAARAERAGGRGGSGARSGRVGRRKDRTRARAGSSAGGDEAAPRRRRGRSPSPVTRVPGGAPAHPPGRAAAAVAPGHHRPDAALAAGPETAGEALAEGAAALGAGEAGAGVGDSDERRGLPVPWWWLLVLLVGMGVAFWLGSAL
ncbi:serine/threonine protein kinase [Haliangium ochraceum DSM 14365]|uniref:non-specific serine/threonine protein kinase n=2 Tax=Haliangium ochraceum TaxID=80816 RepID=D0LZB7_HALO1|nr:serine/threonine protein kinase [Haliangium ochraceum DSM 14365]